MYGKFGSVKLKKNEGKGGTKPRGFYDKKTEPKSFGTTEKKTFSKKPTGGFKKPFTKKSFTPRFDYKKAIEVLGKDVVLGIKITNPKLINGHIIELVDYVNARNNNYLKDGDRLIRCRWQLKKIDIRDNGKIVSFDLKGSNSTFTFNNRIYVVQMLFETDEFGKQGMKVCLNGFEAYDVLRNLECIEFSPMPPKDGEYKSITIRGDRKVEDKSLNTRRLELKITDSQMDKLEYLRQKHGKDCIADMVRKLISEA